MSYFSDTHNPYLIYHISDVVRPSDLNKRLKQSAGPGTAASRLYCALTLVEAEVCRLEEAAEECRSRLVRALEVLGAVQSELNLHCEAVSTYQRIVLQDDIEAYKLYVSRVRIMRRLPRAPQLDQGRSLIALFNLALQLNKCEQYIEAEVALRRLIPLVRAKHGRNSFQYRNSLEQLVHALHYQGCREAVQELWQEYIYSQNGQLKNTLWCQNSQWQNTNSFTAREDSEDNSDGGATDSDDCSGGESEDDTRTEPTSRSCESVYSPNDVCSPELYYLKPVEDRNKAVTPMSLTHIVTQLRRF